jgi:ribosomal protein L7/L12
MVAVELQWDLDEDDQMRCAWCLEICAIVTSPGWSDSRFSSVGLARLPAETPAERTHAKLLAGGLAERLGVELCSPSLEEAGGKGGSRWMERQGLPPDTEYRASWEAYWWTDDGDRVSDAGAEEVRAVSGERACASVENRVRVRVGGTERPAYVRTRLASAQARWSSWSGRHVSSPMGMFSPPDAVRAWRLEGRSAVEIIAALRQQAPHATVLAIMLALEQSFDINLDALAPVATWANGRLSADELGRALDGVITAARPRWDRARRLRDAYERGESLAALLLDELPSAGHIQLIKALKDAFGLSLREAKPAVDGLTSDPEGTRRVDAELLAAISPRNK